MFTQKKEGITRISLVLLSESIIHHYYLKCEWNRHYIVSSNINLKYLIMEDLSGIMQEGMKHIKANLRLTIKLNFNFRVVLNRFQSK